jgi:hypothetical protein
VKGVGDSLLKLGNTFNSLCTNPVPTLCQISQALIHPQDIGAYYLDKWSTPRGCGEYIGDILTCYATIEVSGAINTTLKNVIEAAKSADYAGTAFGSSNAMGNAGMEASGVEPNTSRIPSLSNTAYYRVPDGLNETTISEVKNVAYQAYTNQIKDYLLYSKDKRLTFELWTRPDTILSRPLQNLIDKSEIVQKYINIYNR